MTPPQGKKKGKPAPPPAERSSKRTLGLAVFGVLLVGLFAGVALAQGLGNPSVPSDAIAIIEDAPEEEISVEQYERSLTQTAARQGLQEVPAEDDPQFELLREAAIADLILSRWVLGEAEERGVEVSEREIDEELETVKTEQFGCKPGEEACQEFDKFLEDSGFSPAEAEQRIQLQLVSDRIQESVLPTNPPINEDEVQAFYEENQAQFEQPETRDVRVILTENEEDADEALAELEQSTTAENFEQVAKDFSIDEATKSTGGLREGVIEGQSEPALDAEIFSAPEGELVGPIETDAGFALILVEGITPASTAPLNAQTREQITQTLIAARQQQIATTFQASFTNKWRARTYCAEDYRIDRCSNSPSVPDPCTEEVADTTGCGAPVPSTKPIPPGSAGVFGAPAPTGLPQGPISPQSAGTPPGGLPPGLIPGAPPGAAPPGAAPPGAAPPGAAPPGAAPPGAAPPGAAPPGAVPPGG